MRRFRDLNLADLLIGLDDLFTTRHADFVSTKVGEAYAELLDGVRTQVNALPPALTGRLPLVEEISAVDGDHDGFGGAIYYMTEAYLRLPGVDPAVLAAVKRIRATFVPELDQLRSSYADEAAAAMERKPALKELESDLKLVPVAKGGSLYDWAVSFVGAGEKLGKLLSDRASADTGGRENARKLRTEAVGLLNRARAAIADQVSRKAGLSPELDAKIFGLFDELEEKRVAANRAAKAKKEHTG
jgi:hypothetical protein